MMSLRGLNGSARHAFVAQRRRRWLQTSHSSHLSLPTVWAYADGACRGNPGPGGCGALLMHTPTKQIIAQASRYLGDQETNNTAEYNALLLVLELAKQEDITQLHVLMDSQLIIRQMQGLYRVKAPALRRFHDQCQALIDQMDLVVFSHIPREQNAVADRLANQAIDLKQV